MARVSGNVLGAAPSPLADIAVGTLGPKRFSAQLRRAQRAKRERARELQSRARVLLDERQRDQALLFERDDWRLFVDPATLPQKAGCQPANLRQIVLREIVDNALDAGADATLERDGGAWVISDDGPGLDPADVPRLFAVNRPLLSVEASSHAVAWHARQRPASCYGRGRRVGRLYYHRDARPSFDARH